MIKIQPKLKQHKAPGKLVSHYQIFDSDDKFLTMKNPNSCSIQLQEILMWLMKLILGKF